MDLKTLPQFKVLVTQDDQLASSRTKRVGIMTLFLQMKRNIGGRFLRSVELPYSDYNLCYALNGYNTLGDLVAKIKLLTALTIVLVTSNVYSGIKADNTFYDIGPREFL